MSDARKLYVRCEGRRAQACTHPEGGELVRNMIEGGGVQVVEICPLCQARIRGPLKHAEHPQKDSYQAVRWTTEPCPCEECEEHRQEGNELYARRLRERLVSEHFRAENRMSWKVRGREVSADTHATAKEYLHYLRSDAWRRRRRAAIEAADGRCQLCNDNGSSGPLTAHHRTYERLGDERPRDLTVLCRECHDHFHNAWALPDDEIEEAT